MAEVTRIAIVRLAAAALLGLAGCRGTTETPPDPAPSALRPAPVFWVLPDSADVLPEGEPPPQNPIWPREAAGAYIALSGAPGETLGFQLVIGAEPAGEPPRKGVQVRFSELGGADGALPASQFTAFRADWVKVERFRPWYPAETGRAPQPRLFADPLTKLEGPFDPDPRRHQPLFVDLDIPTTARPGRYEGRLTIASEGGQPAEIDVRLDVWPFLLPRGKAALPVVARLNLARLLQWSAGYGGPIPVTADLFMHGESDALKAGRERLPAALDLLRSHGIRPMIEDLRPTVDFRWPGTAKIDWAAYDEFLERYLPADGDRPREPLAAPLAGDFPDPAKFVASREDDPGAAARPFAYYQRAVRHYAGQVGRHFRDIGRLGSAVVLYDPPADTSPALALTRAAGFASLLAETDAAVPVVLPFSARYAAEHLTGPAEPTRNALASSVGIWRSPGAWFGPPESGPKAEKSGPPVWLAVGDPPFLPSRRIEAPRTGIVNWGWAAWRYRPDALDIGSVNPWPAPRTIDADAAAPSAPAVAPAPSAPADPPPADRLTGDPAGEPPWIYPGGPDGVRPSIRLKLLRRAVQDHQYLEILAKVAGPARTASLGRVLLGYALHESPGAAGGDGRFGGWSADPDLYEDIRRAMGGAIAKAVIRGGAQAEMAETPREWEKFLARSERVELAVAGTRLTPGAGKGGKLEVRVRVANVGALPRDDLGALALDGLPFGWRLQPAQADLPRVDPAGTTEITLTAVGGAEADAWETAAAPEVVWKRPAAVPPEHRIPLRVCRQFVRAVVSPPVIDGDLGEWANLAGGAAAGFVSTHRSDDHDGVLVPARLSRPTSVRAVCDEQYLYFAVECGRNPGDTLYCRPGNQVMRDGAALWGEDAVEILLAPPAEPGKPAKVYRVAVKRNGAVERAAGPAAADGKLPSEPWAADVAVACSPEDESAPAWRAEIRIPWESLGGRPAAGRSWGVNYSRHISYTGETGCWSASPRHIFRPETMGTLTFP